MTTGRINQVSIVRYPVADHHPRKRRRRHHRRPQLPGTTHISCSQVITATLSTTRYRQGCLTGAPPPQLALQCRRPHFR